jgi:ligand-binding sensor protein
VIYVNRQGFADRVAPLMQKYDTHSRLLLWNDVPVMAEMGDLIRLEPDDWHAKEELLLAARDQGAFEVVLNDDEVFRLSEALMALTLQKTNSACL